MIISDTFSLGMPMKGQICLQYVNIAISQMICRSCFMYTRYEVGQGKFYFLLISLL